jgi:hypothetical protein
MEDADSDLSSDNDSKPTAKNSYSKRPARKKPIAMTCAAKVSRPAERHQEVDDESSGDGFQADADDPDYVDEDPSMLKKFEMFLKTPMPQVLKSIRKLMRSLPAMMPTILIMLMRTPPLLKKSEMFLKTPMPQVLKSLRKLMRSLPAMMPTILIM